MIVDSSLDVLVRDLGVAADALAKLGVTRNGTAWEWPERDGCGAIIGTATRDDAGVKKMHKGGNRGLTYVDPLGYAGSTAANPLLLVEGMSDTAAALTAGFDAIGRPSATGGNDHLLALLDDTRHVCIVGENDASAGHKGAEKCAAALHGKVASLKIVYPPEGIKDLRAWVQSAGLDAVRQELATLTDDAREWEPVANEAKAAEGDFEDADGKTPSQSEMLVRLALEQYRIGRNESGEPFAVPIDGPSMAMMFRGSRDALRAQLAQQFRASTGRTPSAAALADAMTVLQGIALDVEPESVHLRLAGFKDGIIIDLGTPGGRCIEVRPDGWSILDRSPVLFRRTALTAALPEPVAGGNLDALRSLLNVSDSTWPLVVGWLVAALMPDIPHPILLLGGLHGVGKSTAARMLVRLIDPSPAVLRSEPRDPEAWAMMAAGSWVVAVDNISSVTHWWSDALCKTVTGDGWVRRKLYSDSDLSVLAFKRVVLLTSIDAGAMRGDLGDRLLLADLEVISPDRRRTEEDLERRYRELQPEILGAILDALVAVLRILPALELRDLPRMADFGRVLAAVDAAGITADALHLYAAQSGRIARDVVESDPVAMALQKFIEEREHWEGTAGDLLEAIKPQHPVGKSWPSNPRGMAGRLKRLCPALATVGVEVVPPAKSDTKHRVYQVRRIATTATSLQIDDFATGAPDSTVAIEKSGSLHRYPNRYAEIRTDAVENAECSDRSDRSDIARANSHAAEWGTI